MSVMRMRILMRYWSWSLLLVGFMLLQQGMLPAADDCLAVVAAGSVLDKWPEKCIEGGRLFTAVSGVRTATIICDGDYERQLADMQRLIERTQGNIIFLVNGCNTEYTRRIAAILEKNRVYWVSWLIKDSSTKFGEYQFWVGHIAYDLVAEGIYAGRELASSIDGKGEIAAIMGPGIMLEHSGKIHGLYKVLANYPEIRLVEQVKADGSRESGYEQMELLLSRYPDLSGVWVATDSVALGVIDALKAHNMTGKIKVAGIGGSAELLLAVKQGEAVAAVYTDIPAEIALGLSRAYVFKMHRRSFSGLSKRDWMMYANVIGVNSGNVNAIIEGISVNRTEKELEQLSHEYSPASR